MPIFQLPDYPRSGSKAMGVERKKEREKERREKQYATATMVGTHKTLGPKGMLHLPSDHNPSPPRSHIPAWLGYGTLCFQSHR